MAKLKLSQYSEKFPKIFERMKKKIFKAMSNKDIYYIGSTAVPGLGGKGIIDIMAGVKNWKKTDNFIKKLKKIGFKHIHPKERGKFVLRKQEITIDNVKNAGWFVEIENTITDYKEREKALNENIALLNSLGINKKNIIEEPYRDIVLKRKF